MLDHRGEFLLAGCELLLQVSVEGDLVLEQQQGKVHLVDALAHVVQAHVELSLLHSALLTGYTFLCTDHATVKYSLLHVQPHAVLVLGQAFHVQPHLPHHGLHLVGPRRHSVLISRLSGRRHLRQPPLLDIGNREVGSASDEVMLGDERIVALGSLLALFQGLSAREKRQQGQCYKQ